MEITGHTTKNLFNEHVSKLLDDMQASYDNETISSHIEEFQSRVDRLDTTYPENERLGQLRYKLYEAQAYIHYFRNDNERALDFIDEAIKIRGGTFSGAETLKDSILKNDLNAQNNAELIYQQPIEGWLSWLIASLGLGTLYNIYHSFTGWGNLSGITPAVNAAYPNIRNLIIAEQLAPILAAVLGITTIVLILQRKHLARTIGITFTLGVLIWQAADYSIATSMFANNTAALNYINSSESSNAHFAFFSIVWLLYLIFSKRVKATLVS